MKGHKISTNSEALKFMFASKAHVTFLNTKTGNRFTYKIKAVKNSNLFFVSVLTSPDVWSYLGTIVDGNYKVGKKSNISTDAQSNKVFSYVLKNLKSNTLPDFIEVWHEGFCGKCGRRLTVPQSILNGLGPECIKSLSKVEKRDKFLELILS
jgi:hypothetical protein